VTSGLAFRCDGEGEPLLLLNGIAMSIASWEPVAAPLARWFRVIRCDMRGQLLSPVPPPADVAEHADDVLMVLDKLGVARCHVVATSFGGAVGAVLAARYPERVASYVTIASADGFDEEMADEVRRWRQATIAAVEGPNREALAQALEPVVYSADWLAGHQLERRLARAAVAALPDLWYRNLVQLIDSADSFVLEGVLDKVRCPTLVVAAGEDGFIPRDRCRSLAEAIPGAEFEVIDGAGHAVVVEQPGRIVEIVQSFLDRRNLTCT
jgi:3-oxoadipate enol-lactonase